MVFFPFFFRPWRALFALRRVQETRRGGFVSCTRRPLYGGRAFRAFGFYSLASFHGGGGRRFVAFRVLLPLERREHSRRFRSVRRAFRFLSPWRAYPLFSVFLASAAAFHGVRFVSLRLWRGVLRVLPVFKYGGRRGFDRLSLLFNVRRYRNGRNAARCASAFHGFGVLRLFTASAAFASPASRRAFCIVFKVRRDIML